MAASINIGLNLSTALLINVLTIASAAALTMHARSLPARLIKAILITASIGVLVIVIFSLPHAPLF